MKTDTVDLARVASTLEDLRRELSELGQRIATLEAAVAPASSAHVTAPPEQQAGAHADAGAAAPVAESVPPQAVRTDRLDEELVLVISAAIAAFLGKKPHIRQIRLIGSAAWAQQGRVTIQASHAISVHSARS